MATRIYKTPFAATGDKEALAAADQPDGKVSLQAGWTPDYELPNDNPNYPPVGRAEMNGVLGEITEGLGDVQLNGFATWQAIVGGWPIGALVSHGEQKYQSTTGSNTTTPGAVGSNWERVVTTVGTLPVASSSAAGIVELATNAETQAGADAGRAVTPAGLQSKVQATATDASTGRLLAVGAFGLGYFAPSSTTGYGYPNDFNAMDSQTSWVTIGGSYTNGPGGAVALTYAGILHISRGGATGMSIKHELECHPTSANGAGSWIRYGSGNPGARTWTDWERVITSRTIPAASEAVQGIAQIATQAQAQAQTDDTRMLTSKKLADAFKGSNQVLASASGFQRLPGGLILQWGNANAVNGSVVVTFPIAFPTANFTGTSDTDTAGRCTAYRSVSNSQCEILLHNTSGGALNGTARWTALGY